MDLGTFHSPDHVLSNILVTVNDEALKKGFNKGWYYNMMYKALSELNFTGYYNKCVVDIHDWYTEGEQKSVKVPDGCFSMDEVHLFDGDKFEITKSVRVEWKVDFNNDGKLSGHTAMVKDSGTEVPYGRAYFDSLSQKSSVYYAAVQNGKVMLADSCTAYSHVRLIFKGVPGKIGEAPLVPNWLEDAVHDFVCERFFRSMRNKESKYRTNWVDAVRTLKGAGREGGSWHEALLRCSSLSKFERNSLTKYFERGNW